MGDAMKLRWLFTEPSADEPPDELMAHVAWRTRFHTTILLLVFLCIFVIFLLLVLSAFDNQPDDYDPRKSPVYGAELIGR